MLKVVGPGGAHPYCLLRHDMRLSHQLKLATALADQPLEAGPQV